MLLSRQLLRQGITELMNNGLDRFSARESTLAYPLSTPTQYYKKSAYRTVKILQLVLLGISHPREPTDKQLPSYPNNK
jgi:hypothetical protein